MILFIYLLLVYVLIFVLVYIQKQVYENKCFSSSYFVRTKVLGNYIPYKFVHYFLYAKVENKRDNAIKYFTPTFESKSQNIDPR